MDKNGGSVSDVSNDDNRMGDGEVVSEKRAKQGGRGMFAFNILITSLVLACVAGAVLLIWGGLL